MDSIEKEFERAIEYAAQRGYNDRAFELNIALEQYRKYYKVSH